MEELIIEAKNGNKESFTNLMLDLKVELYKIARIRLSNNEDIEDAIQETMLETFKNIYKLKDTSYFKKWIITILINKCNKIYRKRKKYNISFEGEEFENYLKSNDNLDSNLNFYDILKDLNYNERIILSLHYMEDYTTKDISKLLKVSENTVKTRLRRAKIKLKNKYVKEV